MADLTNYKVNLSVIQSEFEKDFTPEELATYRASFERFDTDKNGELELFELHQMYEQMGETKTHAQLRQIIAEADTNASGGIDFREYLTVILKQKKGILKKGASPVAVDWSQFVAIAAKQHDTSKDTGRKAAADQQNELLREAEIKKKQELRKAELEEKRKQAELKKKLMEEERLAAEAEAARKARVQAKLREKFGGKN